MVKNDRLPVIEQLTFWCLPTAFSVKCLQIERHANSTRCDQLEDVAMTYSEYLRAPPRTSASFYEKGLFVKAQRGGPLSLTPIVAR